MRPRSRLTGSVERCSFAARTQAETMTTRTLTHPLLLATFALLVGGLSGCNTLHGIGKDTERAGEKIQKESDRHHGREHAGDHDGSFNG